MILPFGYFKIIQEIYKVCRQIQKLNATAHRQLSILCIVMTTTIFHNTTQITADFDPKMIGKIDFFRSIQYSVLKSCEFF